LTEIASPLAFAPHFAVLIALHAPCVEIKIWFIQ